LEATMPLEHYLVTSDGSLAELNAALVQVTRERDEARAQQTATADVLKVISRSTFDLQAVLDTLTQSATRLCAADKGVIYLRDGDVFRFHANHGFTEEAVRYGQANPLRAGSESSIGRVALTGRISHIHDVLADPDYKVSGYQQAFGYRTNLGVPLLRDDAVIGVFALTRDEVAPFTDKQIELVTTFADQAVIAIENARLFEAEQQRSAELSEALEQQTATSEVLGAISSSRGELQPVFDAMLANATRICGANFGTLWLIEGALARCVAMHNPPAAFAELRTREPVIHPAPDTAMGRLLKTKRTVHIEDITAERIYAEGDAVRRANADLAGARTILAVPMLKDGEVIGAIGIFHQAVRPFSERQTELVETFAAQAVIAIENARLLSELRESLERQTATSNVLEVISSSPGDLTPVFAALLDNAARVCDAKMGMLVLAEGEGQFRVAAMHGAPPQLIERRTSEPVFTPGPLNNVAIVAKTKKVRHIPDLRLDPSYLEREPAAVVLADLAGARSLAVVPMLKDNELVGVFGMYRQEVRPFGEKQVELLTNFAAQAVIAIENTRLLNELRRRTDDLTESLQQQTATSDILEVISNSPTDSQPAFDAIVRSGLKLFPEAVIVISLPEGDQVRLAALAGPIDLEVVRARYPMPLSREFITGTALLDGREMDFADADEAPEHLMPGRQNFLASGYRAITVMPMMRGEKAIGAISVIHRQPRQLSDKQRELLRTFAAQAVIAIENTRLFSELRQRTDDLTESLQQQTASSEVLASISESVADTKPVFEAIVRNLKRLFGTQHAVVQIVKDGMVHLAATALEEEHEVISKAFPRPLDDATGAGRAMLAKKVVQFAPIIGDPDAPPSMQEFAKQLGIDATIFAPMLREGNVIGAIGIARQEAKPFTEKQVDLIRTFAAQAVIAIENTRLFNELRESLERQTATAEVLSVMSRSKFDLMPILQSVVDTAARLCRADQAVIFRLEDGLYRFAAGFSLVPEYLEIERANPIAPGSGTAVGRAALSRAVVRMEDAMSDAGYAMKEQAAIAGLHSIIGVPLLRDGEPIGVIALARCRVEPFDDREVDLVTTFADQAVIAIENVRLFEEVQARTEDLQESLEQQTATAEVLSVMSRSKFDLGPILQSVVDTAARLCRAEQAAIYRLEDDAYRLAAFSLDSQHLEVEKETIYRAGPGTVVGRAAMTRQAVQIEDVLVDPLYQQKDEMRAVGIRSVLGVPLMRDGEAIGVIGVARFRVEPFTGREIELVTTFTDQAVIAIENVRLFDEIQEKSHQLEEASKHKSQFLANMSHELRTPLNAILGYTELIVDGVYGETPEKVLNALQRITTNGKHLLGLINDVLDLSKIEAGQLTLTLTDYSMKDVVHSVYSAIEPLAAEKKLSFKAEIAPDLPAGHGDERRLTQVLLNLVGNAIKFTDAGDVVIKASQRDGIFSVAVCDTGPGISEDDQKKLFQEFQQADSSTTKKKGGTGLGLAISKKIVEMHGGRIWLESQVGKGSTFAFTVPTRAEQHKRLA
jgi:GAF domain-containing protein